MKKFVQSALLTLSVPAFLLLLCPIGCSFIQKQTIAPGGAYSNDPYLLGIDQTIVETRDDLDGFLHWLQENQPTLWQNNKSVLVAGERIRTNAPTWFTNIYNLRGAYLTARQEADPAAANAASNALSSAASQLSAQSASAQAITNNVVLKPFKP